jgi:hypothetical protein
LEATLAQATETDFAAYARLSESEQKVLEEVLASIPDDILATSDRQSINSRIKNRLQREGILDSGGPLGMGEIPAVAFVGRAVGCLASSYVALRGISNNKPADLIADSIARAIADCATGDLDAVKADILTYQEQVASALKALGLPSLGAALLAGNSGQYVRGSARLDR